MTTKHRILVIAHGHPDLNCGGAELAAYNLFKAYRDHPLVDAAWFLARADRGRGVTGMMSLRREDEYLWEQGVDDWHVMKARHEWSVTFWFADLLRALNPNVVHSHHFAHLGLEYLRVIRNTLPSARLIMTLHEYLAICANSGQMVKTGTHALCSSESLDDCRQCFQGKTVEDFWLRRHYFRTHMSLIDAFVAPSEFLRQRYIQWGIPAEKIALIDNGQPAGNPLPPRPLLQRETRNRFGFFGQINPYKGLDVVLRGLRDLPVRERKKIVLEVHGANLHLQAPEYRSLIEELRAPLEDEGVVRWVGPYERRELRARMASIDWVIVPSIWWENSPLVIQEAFAHGRPVVCSDIGGMAEKVRHHIDGVHVSVGNSASWASELVGLARSDGLWAKLAAGIRAPITHAHCAREHVRLIEQGSRVNGTVRTIEPGITPRRPALARKGERRGAPIRKGRVAD